MQEAIDSANKRFPEGHFFQADVENLNDILIYLMHNTFDYILLPDVLEHLSNPKKVMKYIIHKILKSDGKVFINIPNIMHYSVLYNLITYGRFPYTDTGLLDSDHKHLFTFQDAKIMFQEAGFKKIKNQVLLLTNNFTQEEEDFVQFLLSAENSKCEELEFKAFTYMFMLEKDNI